MKEMVLFLSLCLSVSLYLCFTTKIIVQANLTKTKIYKWLNGKNEKINYIEFWNVEKALFRMFCVDGRTYRQRESYT